MSVTIYLDENRSARVSDERIETRPPDRIGFVAEGILTMTEELLGKFEGATLEPARVVISVDRSETVTVDLTEEASLRLEEVDVGVETPDTDDISPEMDAVSPGTNDSTELPDMNPGALAFTVEGAIINVSEKILDSISEGHPTVESITFTVGETTRSDGGSGADILVEFSLLGYGIVIRRNGIIEIGTGGGVTDVRLA